VHVAPSGQATPLSGHDGTSAALGTAGAVRALRAVGAVGAVGAGEAVAAADGGGEGSATVEVGGAPGTIVPSQVTQVATVLPSATEQDPELKEQV